jgi:phage protein D
MAEPRVQPARPTFAVGGRDEAALTDGLLSMRIEEDVHGLYRCEATFGNWGPQNGSVTYLYFDRRLLDFGKELAVSAGGSELFKGRVTGVEAGVPEGRPPTFTVLAEDRLQDLRMTRRTRTFENVTDSAVMNQIAGDHGLTPRLDVSGPTHKVLAQLNQSDLAFLRERARAIDAELWVGDGQLRASPRSGRGGASITLGFGNELREFTVLADLAHQRTSISVTGWDVNGKSALVETATDSVVSSELGGGKSGPSLLSSALGDRKETVTRTVPLTSQEARARVEAAFRHRARRFVTGRGVAKADGRLRVGAKAKLKGLGPLFSSELYVTEVRHLFDGARGIRTEFAAEAPGLGGGAT